MNDVELRDEIFLQHEELRELAKLVKAAADNATSSPDALLELRIMLDNLADELLEHNHFEERALAALLPEIDGWSPERDLRVAEHHAAEHAAIFATLASVREQCDASALAAEALDVLAYLGSHMALEERELVRGTGARPTNGEA